MYLSQYLMIKIIKLIKDTFVLPLWQICHLPFNRVHPGFVNWAVQRGKNTTLSHILNVV